MNTRSRRIRTRDFGAFQCVYHFIASWKPSAVPPTSNQRYRLPRLLCLPFKPSERFVHFSINAQLQVMLKGKMCVAKRSFFSFWNNYVHVHGTITRQAKENSFGFFWPFPFSVLLGTLPSSIPSSGSAYLSPHSDRPSLHLTKPYGETLSSQ